MEIVKQNLIFEISDAPTLSCHASTIALHKNSLYAAWFGGTTEGADDVAVWLAKKDGKKWDIPFKMSASEHIPHWNPVLFSLGNRLFLYYKKGETIPEWQTFYRVLENGVWSEETELVPGDKGGRGPVKNKPVKSRNGVIIAPASLEKSEEKSENTETPPAGQSSKNSWNVFADISTDGVSWQAQELIAADVNLIQPSIWETSEGLHAFMRSDVGAVYRSDSTDGGISWTAAYKTVLPNNNSGLDTVYAGGNLYVVYNPVIKNWGARTPLTVSKSEDNGKTWTEMLTLENAEGEYSYPSVIEADGFLHIVYTYNRKSIMYVKVKI